MILKIHNITIFSNLGMIVGIALSFNYKKANHHASKCFGKNLLQKIEQKKLLFLAPGSGRFIADRI
jgi:hypothetical protein